MNETTRSTEYYSNPSRSLCTSTFSYRTRGFWSNKGALLTVIWNISAFLLITYSLQVANRDLQMFFFVTTITYPITGWLASVYFGRYNVICFSLRIMAIAVTVWSAFSLAVEYTSFAKIFSKAKMAKKILGNIIQAVGLMGLSGFQANSLQLGLDQFIDASSSDISSYISWYIWSYFLSNCLVLLSQVCLCGVYAKSLPLLLLPLFFTLSLVMDSFFNKWIVKEPVSHNPFKLIFQVLRYAVKNKYPRLRSAFTYWDDKRYSRVDLAKTNFGGPFTAEQVEDVKTFFRILVIIGVASLLMASIVVENTAFLKTMFDYNDDDRSAPKCVNTSASNYMISCTEKSILKHLSSFTMVIFIPLLEFVFYPLLRKCAIFAKIGIMHKFILGMLLLLLYQSHLLSVVVVATNMSGSQDLNCLVVAMENDTEKHLVLSVYFKWLILPLLLSGISNYLLTSSAVEFICAQSPYSMKGLLAGIIYALSGIAIFLLYGWQLVVKKIVADEGQSCGSWYYLSMLVFNVVLVCVGCMVKKWYTLRRRDEHVVDDGQVFAVSQYNSGDEEMPANSSLRSS